MKTNGERERDGRPLEDLLIDLRYAVRKLLMNPGFAVVAILTLALGIGANTAVFSVLHSVILSPLGYHEPDRLVRLYQVHRENPTVDNWVAGAAYLDFRQGVAAFESAAAMYNYRENGFTLTGFGPPRRVSMLSVSADFFDVYRARPIIGRGDFFDAMDIHVVSGRQFSRTDVASSMPVAVINESMARLYFEGRGPLGQPISWGRTFEIVGIVQDVAHDHRGSRQPKVYASHAQFGDDRNWALSQVALTTLPPGTTCDPRRPARGIAIRVSAGATADPTPIAVMLSK